MLRQERIQLRAVKFRHGEIWLLDKPTGQHRGAYAPATLSPSGSICAGRVSQEALKLPHRIQRAAGCPRRLEQAPFRELVDLRCTDAKSSSGFVASQREPSRKVRKWIGCFYAANVAAWQRSTSACPLHPCRSFSASFLAGDLLAPMESRSFRKFRESNQNLPRRFPEVGAYQASQIVPATLLPWELPASAKRGRDRQLGCVAGSSASRSEPFV